MDVGTYKTFLLMHMSTQLMNIYLPTNNTVCKDILQPLCHESTLADRACTDLHPVRKALDYDSHHVPAARLAGAMPLPEVGNGMLKAAIVLCSTAKMHSMQAARFKNITLTVDYCALQMCSRTKKNLILFS